MISDNLKKVEGEINIAILSNSYGEDRSGAIIGKEIKKLVPNASIIVAPLISFGEEYRKRGLKVITYRPPPPSGGFLLKTVGGFLNDLFSCSDIPFSYVNRLRKIRHKIDKVVVVGDILLLVLAWAAFRKRVWFLAPCKSDYISPHLKIEREIMRKIALRVWTHDELTARNLQNFNIPAIFPGNPMMDELEKENRYVPPKNKPLIGILPGSRKEAYKNMKKIGGLMKILRTLHPYLHFAVAVAETVDENRLKDCINNIDDGVHFVRNGFVDIVTCSRLLLSLSGTASEQSAGLGIPIVSFIGAGPQTTSNRLKGQEKLLGGCLKFVSNFPEGVVDEVTTLLSDDSIRRERGRAGKERMGPKGGARRIAEQVIGRA